MVSIRCQQELVQSGLGRPDFIPLVESLLRRMPNTHRTTQNADYVAVNKSVTLGQNILGDVSPTGNIYLSHPNTDEYLPINIADITAYSCLATDVVVVNVCVEDLFALYCK